MVPEITELVKVEGGVPTRGLPGPRAYKKVEWLVTLSGIGTLQLTTCQFFSYPLVQQQCVRQFFCWPDNIGKKQWERMISAALAKLRRDSE